MVKLLFSRWRMAIRLCSLRFTDSAVNDVLRARKHAAERHQREVDPEHVLLALATDARGFARTALVRLGLDLSGQAEAIAALLDAEPTKPQSITRPLARQQSTFCVRPGSRPLRQVRNTWAPSISSLGS
jgi:ATP-dependent Clp protease ATP-binding subunit ClpA